MRWDYPLLDMNPVFPGLREIIIIIIIIIIIFIIIILSNVIEFLKHISDQNQRNSGWISTPGYSTTKQWRFKSLVSLNYCSPMLVETDATNQIFSRVVRQGKKSCLIWNLNICQWGELRSALRHYN